MLNSIFRLLLCSTLALCAVQAFAQQGNTWFFGSNIGLDFNPGAPVQLAGSALLSGESSTVMSDASGQLLYYSGDWRVRNRNHQIMPNGDQLFGNSSSSQGFISLPKPGSTTIFYLFIADDLNGTFTPDPPLTYSEIDMTLDGGLGDVTANKNVELIASTCEKVTATRHANGTDFWVLGHHGDNNEFQAFLVSAAGVSLAPVVSAVGNNVTGSIYNRSGCMKISPNRDKVIICHSQQNLMQLCDFDDATGIVSNPVTKNLGSGSHGPYGAEFSTSGNLLYITAYPTLYQYDITAGTFASETVLGTIGGGVVNPKGLQMGPDCKIYLSKNSNALDVIQNPDVAGAGCNWVVDAQPLAAFSQIGLPHILDEYLCNSNPVPVVTQASFIPSNADICAGDCITFTDISTGTNISAWDWTFASGTPATANTQNPGSVCFNTAGTFDVTLQITDDNGTDDTTIVITVNPCNGAPIAAFSVSATTLCVGECLTVTDLSVGNNVHDWTWEFQSGDPSSSTSQNPGTICYQDAGTYTIFLNVVDDDASDNTILTIEVLPCIPIEPEHFTTYVPNIFSPNNDGNNDLLYLRGSGIKSAEFRVYDRWGETVFTTSDHAVGWDGKFRAEPVNAGVFVYTYSVIFTNGEEFAASGDVTLTR
jgi:gliding motility-associated-like protein